jgi:hypothetical protein
MSDKHGQAGKKTGMSNHKAILQHNSLKNEVTHKTLVRSGYSQLKFKREPVERKSYAEVLAFYYVPRLHPLI